MQNVLHNILTESVPKETVQKIFTQLQKDDEVKKLIGKGFLTNIRDNGFPYLGDVHEYIEWENKTHFTFFENLRLELYKKYSQKIPESERPKFIRLLWLPKMKINLQKINSLEDVGRYFVDFDNAGEVAG